MESKSTLKLYFGNPVTTATTIMIISLIIFMTYTIINRDNIHYWGRRSLFLAVYGLVICCFAAARDGLDKTIQASIDGSCAPGVFHLVSMPTMIGCVGAAVILIAGMVTLFVKKQDVKEILYIVMCSGVSLKLLSIEISRIFM